MIDSLHWSGNFSLFQIELISLWILETTNGLRVFIFEKFDNVQIIIHLEWKVCLIGRQNIQFVWQVVRWAYSAKSQREQWNHFGDKTCKLVVREQHTEIWIELYVRLCFQLDLWLSAHGAFQHFKHHYKMFVWIQCNCNKTACRPVARKRPRN
jgi:hypothetical protein